MKDELHVGDSVRVRYGSRAGEIATVTDVTWHSNQYGSYMRVQILFEQGQKEARGMDSLEKVQDKPAGTAQIW